MNRYPTRPGRGDFREFAVAAAQGGLRLDSFLAEMLPDHSRSYLKGLVEQGLVLLNGQPARRASRRLRPGERVGVALPPPQPDRAEPEPLPLAILYEDADILVLDKPAGLVVHPAAGCRQGTLVNALLHHCRDLSGIGGVLRPGIVHRLDRDTSGVMVVTKNDRAHRHLAEQFKAHRVRKTYLALAVRRPGAAPLPEQCEFVTAYGRHPVHRKRFTSRVDEGKRAQTAVRVLQRWLVGDWELVQVEAYPRTGRTHQIRVHLADHGHPLLGDKLYGGRTVRALPDELRAPRQALHARRLEFSHPGDGRWVTFEAALAADLQQLLDRLNAAAHPQEPPRTPPPGA